MTQLATAASPMVWLTSKHSMRCIDDDMPRASCSEARRSSCVVFWATFWPIASSAFCTAIVTHTRRSPPGFVTKTTLCPDCDVSTSASTGSSPLWSAMMVGGSVQVVLDQERRHDLVERRAVGVLREKRAIANMAPATDHHQIDRRQTVR